uniref:Uncharacterized protein n=1 Tax=Plectus sambesii TaxID=2011161 RepID=A0A914XEB0_9BILA
MRRQLDTCHKFALSILTTVAFICRPFHQRSPKTNSARQRTHTDARDGNFPFQSVRRDRNRSPEWSEGDPPSPTATARAPFYCNVALTSELIGGDSCKPNRRPSTSQPNWRGPNPPPPPHGAVIICLADCDAMKKKERIAIGSFVPGETARRPSSPTAARAIISADRTAEIAGDQRVPLQPGGYTSL